MAVNFNNDILRYATLQQQAQRLAQMFGSGIGSGWARGTQGYDTGRGGDNGPDLAYGYVNPEFQRIAESIGLGNKQSLVGPYGFNAVYGPDAYGSAGYSNDGSYAPMSVREGATPSAYTFTTSEMRHPDRDNKTGAYTLTFGSDGSLRDVAWNNYDQSKGFLAENMSTIAPLLVGGLAALGQVGGAAAAAGGAGASGASSGGYFGGLSATAGGQTGLTAGAAGVTGVTAPAGFVLAPEIGAGVAGAAGGAAGGYMGGLNPAQSGVGLQMPSAPSLGSMGGAQGVVAPGLTPMVAPEALAPLAGATQAPSLVERALGVARTVAPYAQLAGPAMSLLGAVGGDAQGVNAPRLPGAEAPPEARGLERQDPRAAIVDVLNRNRRAGRNRTALTAVGGVNMASTRVGRNTLLGM